MFQYGIPEQGPRVFNCKFLCVCACFMHKVIILPYALKILAWPVDTIGIHYYYITHNGPRHTRVISYPNKGVIGYTHARTHTHPYKQQTQTVFCLGRICRALHSALFWWCPVFFCTKMNTLHFLHDALLFFSYLFRDALLFI